MASDFKIEGVTVDYATLSEGCKRLKLHIGRKDFVFSITSQLPVARLTYDRNRRQFKGIGFNYIEHEGVRYEAPSFKGLTVEKLSEAWQPQIERLIETAACSKRANRKRIPARSRYRRAGKRTQDSRAERGAPAIFSDIHRQTVRHGCQGGSRRRRTACRSARYAS